jgi:hypothetical protein
MRGKVACGESIQYEVLGGDELYTFNSKRSSQQPG